MYTCNGYYKLEKDYIALAAFDNTSDTFPLCVTSPISQVSKCLDNQLRCDKTVCITIGFVCDEMIDCIDGSDEINCSAICIHQRMSVSDDYCKDECHIDTVLMPISNVSLPAHKSNM